MNARKNTFIVIMLTILLFFISICYNARLDSVVILDDENIPLGGPKKVSAAFYLNETSLPTSQVTYTDCTYLGKGQILKPDNQSVILNENEDLSSLITKLPPNMPATPDAYLLKWEQIVCSGNNYYVIGSYIPIKINENAPVPNTNISDKDEFINLRKYGAVGDGITDDYAAFQSAIIAAQSTGKNLYVPNGTYYISTCILLDFDISIIGEDVANTTILFRDTPNSLSEKKTYQRGLVTFNSNKLSCENITFRYTAQNNTPYQKSLSNLTGSSEGVLFAITRGSQFHITNCAFVIDESLTPSMTCMWFKSETADITDVTITNCSFKNYSISTIGGCLWISAHDNSGTKINNASISGCIFEKSGNDEALALWGYNISNILVSDNTFRFNDMGGFNNVFINFGCQQFIGTFKNVVFKNNTIALTGDVKYGIQVLNTSTDSDITIENNQLSGSINSGTPFSCLRTYDTGSVRIANNTYTFNNGKNIAYLTHDKKTNISASGEQLLVMDSGNFTLVKSVYSSFYTGCNIFLDNCNFSYNVTNSQKGLPKVQLSDGNILSVNQCTINANESPVHDFVFQTFVNPTDISSGYVSINGTTSDIDLVFNVPNNSCLNYTLNNNICNRVLFNFPSDFTGLESILFDNNSVNDFLINYKSSSIDLLTQYMK